MSTEMEIVVNSDMSKIDLPEVERMLSTTYWSPGITSGEIRKGMDNSALVVGAYDTTGKQVGFLRVISDKTRFAYIMDVIVDEPFRRKGIGRKMVGYALRHEELRDVYQWLLITTDAHGVYAKEGFKPLENPERWMMIRHERPFRPDFDYRANE